MTGPQSCQGHIATVIDVERMRREARTLAAAAGCDHRDAETVALAVSELAANLMHHAPGGEIVVSVTAEADGVAIAVESRDAGPGIANVELALRDGFSTRGGLGSGLPAVRRLLADFTIATGPGGTTIRGCKRCANRSPSP